MAKVYIKKYRRKNIVLNKLKQGRNSFN